VGRAPEAPDGAYSKGVAPGIRGNWSTMVLIAAAAQSMARIAILLVDQPLEDAVVAWVEWDEVIKVSVSDIRTVPLVLDFNQVNRLCGSRT